MTFRYDIGMLNT